MTKLREWLAEREITAKSLATGAGLSTSAVSRAINGERCGASAAMAIAGFVSANGGSLTAHDILSGIATFADNPIPAAILPVAGDSAPVEQAAAPGAEAAAPAFMASTAGAAVDE